MKKRERKYHQSKLHAKKFPFLFIKKRRGGINIGVHKDRLNDVLKFSKPEIADYDGVKIKRFLQDEFSLTERL